MKSWDELAGAALARQFPAEPPALRSGTHVAGAVRRLGPVQSQTARSPFLALAARHPGTTHAAVTEAYEAHALVRGSTLRGTVHTMAAEDHPLHEVATRLGQAVRWQRFLGLEQADLEALWRSIEDFARDDWHPPAALTRHLGDWLARRGVRAGIDLDSGMGRYLAFGHGALIRRPLRGGWEGQGAPGYRTAAAVLGDRSEVLADPDGALTQLFGGHLAAHGPASREDLAWWSGLPRRDVDRVVDAMGVHGEEGPDGRVYLDLPGAPEPRRPDGVRLLPEFDALLCAYQPAARQRFAEQRHLDELWGGNGLISPPLLVDGRITGYWRAMGSARRRPLEVVWFAGTRRPRKAELVEPVTAVEAALGIEVTEVTVRREAV